jgi:rhamnosyltransferase
MRMNTTVVVGVVTYEPDLEALSRLLSEIDAPDTQRFVVDNGSSNGAELQTLCAGFDRVTLLQQAKNQGLATAINIVILEAVKAGADYVMLVDQDSKLSTNYVSILLSRFQELRSAMPRLGALGGEIQDLHTGKPLAFRGFGRLRNPASSAVQSDLQQGNFLISSGTLMAMDCLQDVGVMRDQLFIDSIDLDWCFRATHRGWQLFQSNNATLFQRIGNSVIRILGWRSNLHVHAPRRYYTMTRNRLFLYRQSYTPWGWCIHDFASAVLKLMLLLIFSPNRFKIAASHWRGVLASFNFSTD